jgi:hypothetical protein
VQGRHRPDRLVGIVDEERRDLERGPAVDAAGRPRGAA